MYNVTTAARIGGVESFVWGASAALARRGHEVHIFSGRGDRLESVPEGTRVFLFPFTARERLPNLGHRFRKLGERLSFALHALPAVIGGGYDILHVHKPYDLPAAALARRRAGLKVVLGCHGRDFFATDRLWFRAVDAAVSCSEFNARQIRERYGVLPAVIYNGIDPEAFQPVPPDASWRASVGIAPEERVILYVGRLIGWKGVGDLLRALSFALRRRPGIRLVLVGEGEERGKLERQAGELGISRQVTFAGAVARASLPGCLACADAFVLPSVADETFGISLCEAMSCGLPVVATRVGGIPEVVAEGVSGFLVDPGDAAGMAEKILLLVTERELGRRMGSEGRRLVQSRFSWERVARALEEEYRRLWRSPAAPPGGSAESERGLRSRT